MRYIVAICAAALCLSACEDAPEETASPPEEIAQFADLPEQAADAQPAGPPSYEIDMTVPLMEWESNQLMEMLAGSRLFAEVMRTKELTGYVVEPGKDKDLERAQRDLEQIKANLARLSEDGVPTYALVHSLDGSFVTAWLFSPDGGIIMSNSGNPYQGLGQLTEGIGVNRFAEVRAPRLRGEPAPTPTDLRQLRAEDNTEEAKAKREETLAKTADQLLPRIVGEALAERQGRLLIVGTRDTGTAPYAALKLGGREAYENWSFVVLPDIASLAGEDLGFDHRRLDLEQAVIVGNPDLSDDPVYIWKDLPGAELEAKRVASRVDPDKSRVLMGKEATRQALVSAIKERPKAGMIYIATHAIADQKVNPLTQGLIAMSGKSHYRPGHIRQERFDGMRENNPIVVMSACQTGLGRYMDGGGFGVARTWTAKGASQVIASLWNVSDKATLILMTRFMDQLKKGKAPEIAMQEAQRMTRDYRDSKGNYPFRDDPKLWASFTVYGQPSIATSS